MTRSYCQTLEQGYEKFVIKNDSGCWDWRGTCPKNPGYGQFRSNGKIYRAHRASWMINFGNIPQGKFVCHVCDNRKCSNPSHLYLATCKENNIDMLNKGRTPILGKKGIKNPNSKLNECQVEEIRNLLKTGISQDKIAEKFHVSQSAISVINTGRYWR